MSEAAQSDGQGSLPDRAHEEVQPQEALRRYAREQSALYGIAGVVARTLAREELLPAVLDEVLLGLEADVAWILLPGLRPGDPFRIAGSRGTSPELLDLEAVRAIRHCPIYQHLVVEQDDDIERLTTNCAARVVKQVDAQPLGTAVCVPLRAGSRVLGILKIGWRGLGAAWSQRREFLLAIGRHVAIALYSAQWLQDDAPVTADQLATTLAHEINNPLQSVDSCLTLLQEELDGDQERDMLDRYLDVATSEVRRIAAILHRMRDRYPPVE